jgi:hypothetical protein
MKGNKALGPRTAWVAMALLPVPLWAGVASFTPEEVGALRFAVKHSPEAAQWAQSVEKRAEGDLAEDPHPIEQIQTAGKLQGSAEKTATQEALKDMGRIKDLELAYALTGRADYLAKAAAFVTAWAAACRPPENPIDATNLGPLLEAYDLVRPRMREEARKKVDDWVRSLAGTLTASDDPAKGTHWNNWQSHRLKILALSAFLLGDQEMEYSVLRSFRALSDKNLHHDGTTLDFKERDALHYHVYDLEPLLRLAMLFDRAWGLDLYRETNAQGGSLQGCVQFLFPFLTGIQTHREYVHTTVQFDLARARNHEKGHGIGEPFDPKAALKCVELAQFFEPGLKAVVGELSGNPRSVMPTPQVLLNEVTRPKPGSPTVTP